MTRLSTLLLTFIIALFIALAPTGTAQACEMSSSQRSLDLVEYVSVGQSCLNTPPPDFTFSPTMEAAFLEKINAERRKQGLAPFKLREALKPAARFHSLDMGINGFFGHKTPLGRTHPARISAFDRTLIAAITAENVARLEMKCEDGVGRPVSCADMNMRGGDPMRGAVRELHRQLMDSPGHRKNILAKDTTHIAIGVARTRYGVYVTQNFAKVSGTFERPVPLMLAAGRHAAFKPTLYDWDVRGLALMTDDSTSDLNGTIIPVGTQGQMDLSVRGEKDASGNAFRYIYLPGPTVKVAPARDS